MLIQRFLPGKSEAWYAQAANRLYCAGLALLLVLSEVFSSNIQATLPRFSHLCRLGLTGLAVLLLAAKVFLFTRCANRRLWGIVCAALAYAAFAAWYGDDVWFFLAVLVGLGAKDADLRAALKTYLAAAAACLVLVQLLHFTGLVPFNWYCRNWDFGYGHYNGYGARLLGVFLAWAWLRWARLRWFDWLGLAALAAYTLLVPGSRGAGGAMLVLLALFCLQRLLPGLFRTPLWRWGLLSAYPLFTALCMGMGWLYAGLWEQADSLYMKVNRLLSGRFEVWERVFWHTPASLLGGVPTDGDEHHAIDNIYLAIPMNKGVVGAVVVAAVVLLLLWRLLRAGAVCESICLAVLLCYGLMENKLFLVSANPLVLLLPCALLWQAGEPLPVLHQPGAAQQPSTRRSPK